MSMSTNEEMYLMKRMKALAEKNDDKEARMTEVRRGTAAYKLVHADQSIDTYIIISFNQIKTTMHKLHTA
jgi:hypothetical protein